METIKILIVMLFSTVLILSNGCSDSEPTKETFLEGEPVPGIEIFFPLGFYDAEPLMPKISPDGKKLLFTGPSGLPEWRGLWIMDLETLEKTKLHSEGRSGDWSSDSDWIAFNIDTEIYKINIDGTGLMQLTYPIDVTIGGSTYSSSSFSPDWSGDNKIAYYLSIDYRTNEDGLRIISDIGEEINKRIKLDQPDWRFGDNTIIGIRGVSSTNETNFPVYNVSLDEVEFILNGPHNQPNRFPKYSSTDGSISFFNSNGIYILKPEEQILKRIIPSQLYDGTRNTDPKIYSAFPSWYPDGKHIIYENFEITRSRRISDATHVEGTIRFYKVNVDSAISNTN